MRFVAIILFALLITTAHSQSARVTGPVEAYNITSFPLYGKRLFPSDSEIFAIPGFVRADSAGTVVVICQESTEAITLELSAGEFAPCRVKMVKATGTDAATLHLFY